MKQTLSTPSPYHRAAASLRENGYSAIPIMPGEKTPGRYTGGQWLPLPGWSRFCDAMAPEFQHEQWELWPEAGVGVAHGAVVACDVDCDRKDIADAAMNALGPSVVRRRGAKGFAAYYRAGGDIAAYGARVRWYEPNTDRPVLELLLAGTQSVLPPTIHPDTGAPYVWITEASLEDTALADLIEMDAAAIERLDEAMARLGLTRQAPRRVSDHEYERPAPTAHDLEKPFGRSLNDRALEPEALDEWWPALNMPKTRQRGRGAWEAVAFWRASGSGRPSAERNPNLKVIQGGIVDFGADRSYTPIDVVMHARECDFADAAEWLKQYVRAEPDAGAAPVLTAPPPPKPQPTLNYDAPTLDMLMAAAPDMPQVEHLADGLLAEITEYVRDAMRRDWPEAAFMVALSVMGVAIGRNFQTWTGLRSNLYCVVLAGSGWGKTSTYNPAVELMMAASLDDLLGSERIMSDSGLVNEVFTAAGKKKIYFQDEFGHMLQRCTERGAGGHIRKIVTEFTNLYSKAGGLYGGSAYADGSRATRMWCPHINIYGMATPEQFWKAFGSGALEDGTLARFSICKTTRRPPRKPSSAWNIARISEARDRLAPALAELAAMTPPPRGNLSGHTSDKPDAFTVTATPAAEAMWQALEETVERIAIEAEESQSTTDMGGILGRVAETAAKIALIFAVSRMPAQPVIGEDDMHAGIRLAWWFAHVAIEGARTHVADNEGAALRQRVLDYIAKGPNATRRRHEIGRRFKLAKKELSEIIDTLKDLRQIVESRPDDGEGRPPTLYTAIDH